MPIVRLGTDLVGSTGKPCRILSCGLGLLDSLLDDALGYCGSRPPPLRVHGHGHAPRSPAPRKQSLPKKPIETHPTISGWTERTTDPPENLRVDTPTCSRSRSFSPQPHRGKTWHPPGKPARESQSTYTIEPNDFGVSLELTASLRRRAVPALECRTWRQPLTSELAPTKLYR